MNGYICFYNGKKVEVLAETTYEAQVKAAKLLSVPAKRNYQLVVLLAEKDGKPVEHLPLF